MADIKKEELHDLVFVTAHNSGQLNDEVIRLIAEFDGPTYRRLLEVRLQKREKADRTGSVGGGTRSTAFLREALANLEFILTH
jgi:hypothetical protein